jgi:hypothetical protein
LFPDKNHYTYQTIKAISAGRLAAAQERRILLRVFQYRCFALLLHFNLKVERLRLRKETNEAEETITTTMITFVA